MTVPKTLARAAALGLCVVATTTSAFADPGKGNGHGPAATPPGQERKAEQAPQPSPTPMPETKGQAHASEHEQEASERKAEKASAPSAKAHAKSEAKANAKAAEKSEPKHEEEAKTHGQQQPKVKAKGEEKAKETAKPTHAQAKAKPADSGSYKDTSRGTDLKKGMTHKHTICHATGSSSNPYVVITPSVSGVFNGHLGHQDGEDIVPPFTYKGVTYSQNWDAEGQALFANGCALPAADHDGEHEPEHEPERGDHCPPGTRTEQVLVGIWHATGAVKDGQRKYVLISPSEKSAHFSKHEEDIPVYETRTVPTSSGERCDEHPAPGSGSPQHPTAPQHPAAQPQPQPVHPVAPGATPEVGTVGVLPVKTSAQKPAVEPSEADAVLGAVAPGEPAEKQAGGVLGAVTDAPEALAKTATTGTLPFTGLPLWIAALVGGALLAAGVAIRRSA